MTPGEIFEASKASVANIVLSRNGERISSGTGFLLAGKLITCAHVLNVNRCAVDIRFEHLRDGQSASWHFGDIGEIEFRGLSAENSYDYAIINPPQNVVVGPSLRFAANMPAVGDPICGLGFPFEDPYLTLNHGFVGAIHPSGPATMLKLDMSVNPSNSGGPLISTVDGNVVGVIARKAAGLTRAFDQLIANYDQNIRVLNATKGVMNVAGIDPMEVLAIGQGQMQQVSREIQRSANVGIGYAVWIEPLCQEGALVD